jgi:hypothetical protein
VERHYDFSTGSRFAEADKMTIICAWCGQILGEKFPEQFGVTHGICNACKTKVLDPYDHECRVDDQARQDAYERDENRWLN